MPQFDTFAFFTQLFWVFFLFVFFYLLISLQLLPAIAVTLKVRKRIVALATSNESSSNSSVSTVGVDQNFIVLFNKFEALDSLFVTSCYASADGKVSKFSFDWSLMAFSDISSSSFLKLPGWNYFFKGSFFSSVFKI